VFGYRAKVKKLPSLRCNDILYYAWQTSPHKDDTYKHWASVLLLMLVIGKL